MFNHNGDAALPRSDPSLSAPEKGKHIIYFNILPYIFVKYKRQLINKCKAVFIDIVSQIPNICN